MKRLREKLVARADAGGVKPVWCWLGLLIVTLLAYGPVWHAGFIWDDAGHITKPELRSFGGLARIWFEVGATQQYYPVLHSVFWLEHRLFGDAAAAYHGLNVLWHVVAAGLFAVTLRRLNVPGAWFAASLFALHPVGVESVAWVSEQKNTLSTVLYLLAALTYLRFDETRRKAHYAAATGLFVAALGTKTVTASLPAALLVIFWWKRGRLELRRDFSPLAPWLVLALAAGVLTSWVEKTFIGAHGAEFELDWVQRGLLASRVIWFYLGKLVWPAELIFIYPRWEIDARAAWQYVFPVGLMLVALGMWKWRSRRGAIAAGLFFAGTLFPALGFVNVFPFVFSFVADHFQYLASLGIFALAGAGVALGWRRFPIGSTAALSGVLVVLGLLTWRQSESYRDEFTLYRSTLAKNPNAAMAHNNLGNLLVDSGRAADALPHFEAATRLQPDSAKYEYSFGFALLNVRDHARATEHFARALTLEPGHADARYGLALSLQNLGRRDEAEKAFDEVLQLKPDLAEAHFNVGLLRVQRGDVARAIEHFFTAARLRPKSAEAEFNWALALAASNRLEEALPHFEKATQLAPTRAAYQNSFGRALLRAQRFEETIARCREALRLDPNLAEAHFNLAEALRQTGRAQEAAMHAAEAERLGWKRG